MSFRFVSAYVFAAVFIYVISTGYCRKRVYYFNVDHPKVTYINPEYVANVTFTARRISRSDPAHYMNLRFILKREITNDVRLHHKVNLDLYSLDINPEWGGGTWGQRVKHSFYFYQLLTNARYMRSFVEFHFTTCDLLQTTNIFGVSALTGYYNIPAAERQYPFLLCPMKPGHYRFEMVKILISHIPENFPFDEGQCHYNVTFGKKRIANGQIDFQLLTEQ